MENKSHLISADNVAVGSPVSIENTTAPFDTSSASEATSGNSDCEAKQDSSVAVASADSSAPSASTSEIPSAFTPNSGGAASEMTSMVAGSSVSADAPTDSRENSAAEAAVDSTVAAAPTAAAGVNAILAPAPTKIRVNLQAVGSAPILKKTKFAIGEREKFAVVSTFLRKQLQLSDLAPLFVYVNSAFAPTPDQRVGELYSCFGRAGELQLCYSLQEAWG